MNREIEPYEERPPVLPELIDYLRADRYRQDLESGRPIINVIYNEAPRPAPPAPPEPNIATKYAGHLILATWSLIVVTGVVITFVMLAGAIMTILISTAVCAVAVAGSVRSLRMSKEEARAMRTRARKGR